MIASTRPSFGQVPRERLPSSAEMVFDQLQLERPPASDEQIIESCKTQL